MRIFIEKSVVLYLFLVGTVFFMQGCNSFDKPLYTNPQEIRFQKKINETKAVRKKLNKIKVDSHKRINQFTGDIKKLRKETAVIRNRKNISSSSSAYSDPTIKKNLTLIREKMRKVEVLKETIKWVRRGDVDLELVQKAAESDIIMVKTIPEEKLNELISEIDSAIEKYMPKDGEPISVVKADGVEVETIEEIWNDIVEEEKEKERQRRLIEEEKERQRRIIQKQIKHINSMEDKLNKLKGTSSSDIGLLIRNHRRSESLLREIDSCDFCNNYMIRGKAVNVSNGYLRAIKKIARSKKYQIKNQYNEVARLKNNGELNEALKLARKTRSEIDQYERMGLFSNKYLK